MTSGPYAGAEGAPWRAELDISRSWRATASLRPELAAVMVKRALRWIAAGGAVVLAVFSIFWSGFGGPPSVNFGGPPPSEKVSLATVSRMDTREFLEPPPLTASAEDKSRFFEPPAAANEEGRSQQVIAVYPPSTPAAPGHSRRQPAPRHAVSHRTQRHPGPRFAAPIFGYLAIR